MYTDFVASRDNIQCSLSTLFRYKPFYITPPSERERESCLCINAKTSIYFYKEGINAYRRTRNLSKHYSVTKFLNIEPPINPFMHNVVKWPNIMHERV